MGPNAKGAIIALIAMGLFATHDMVIKVLGARYPAFQILFFSQLLAFPLLTIVLLADPRHSTLRPSQPVWVLARSAAVILAGICAFYAFSHLPMAQVYAILFMTPLLVTLLSIPLLGERVGRHRWAAILAGLAGVLIVLRPGSAALGLGHLAALGTAIATALSMVIVRRLGQSERAVVLMLWPMLGNFLLTGGLLALDYTPMTLPDLALAGVISVLGMSAAMMVIRAYRVGEAAVVAPMQYSQIIWAAFYGWYLFNEAPDAATLIGAGVIISSGLYILIRESGGASLNRPTLTTRFRPESPVAPRPSLLQRLLRRWL